jgi:hypothetical protein
MSYERPLLSTLRTELSRPTPVILQRTGRYIFILNLLIIRGSRPVAVDALVVLKGK